ncbi:MAG: SnoaL-like domain [Solirubrobacteraceae bacterium]|jgi:ketosteroid isomerase-like protein|nr:SnoaL-like domain [Solirubrobacteraceae bacterium]
MSQESLEVVRQWWEAWEAEDLSRGLALMDAGLVTRRLAPMPDPGTWHGPEGLLDVAAEWVDTFDEFAMTGEDFTDAGDHVVVRVEQEGRGSDSRVPVTATFWFVFGVRNGRVVTLDMYSARAEAVAAVGLRE